MVLGAKGRRLKREAAGFVRSTWFDGGSDIISSVGIMGSVRFNVADGSYNPYFTLSFCLDHSNERFVMWHALPGVKRCLSFGDIAQITFSVQTSGCSLRFDSSSRPLKLIAFLLSVIPSVEKLRTLQEGSFRPVILGIIFLLQHPELVLQVSYLTRHKLLLGYIDAARYFVASTDIISFICW